MCIAQYIYVRLTVNLPTPETYDELQRAYDFLMRSYSATSCRHA
nr:hypothetical protein [Escherichia coli]